MVWALAYFIVIFLPNFEFEFFSVLLNRGADFNLEELDGRRPDDLIRTQEAEECRAILRSQRIQRSEYLSGLIEKVNVMFSMGVHSTFVLFFSFSNAYGLQILCVNFENVRSALAKSQWFIPCCTVPPNGIQNFCFSSAKYKNELHKTLN